MAERRAGQIGYGRPATQNKSRQADQITEGIGIG